MNKKSKKFLYHYTKFPAMQNIIENRELWLCNTQFMNDKSEMSHYIKCVEEAVLATDNIEKEDQERIEKVFKDQLNKIDTHLTYCLSMSKRKDDAAQWERYADNGQGVCIIFGSDKLKQVSSDVASLQEVYYTEDAHKSKHTELFKKYLIEKANETPELGSMESAFWNAWVAASAYKHISFKSEKEVRLIVRENLCWKKPLELKYKMENWGVREYYPLKIADDNCELKRIIKGIIIGPKANATENIVKRYLKSLDPIYEKIEVIKSQCPLR